MRAARFEGSVADRTHRVADSSVIVKVESVQMAYASDRPEYSLSSAGTVEVYAPDGTALASQWNTEAFVKSLDWLNRRLLGVLAHGHCELVHEAHLAEQNGERRLPVVEEPDLGLELEEVLIRSIRSEEPEPHVNEPGLHDGAANPKINDSP